jgi:hypothetical protein
MATSTREKMMRAPRWALAAAVGACLAAGSGAALAAEPGPDALPINVIAVQTNDADDQAEALTKALRTAVRAMPGWSLGPGDYSLEVLALSLKCPEPPDANCQSRIADQIKTDRYIWGTLAKKKGTPMVTGAIHLWVRGKGESKVPIEYSANLTEAADDSLRKIATDAIYTLTGGPPKGGIHIRAGDVAGQVFIDGQPMGALKAGDGTFKAPSGPHLVTVKAVGYADAQTQIVVKPTDAPTEVVLTLTQVSTGPGLNWKRIGGYGAIGVGVVFGVVGLASALKVNGLANDPQYTQFRQAQGTSVSDVCAAATQAKNTLIEGDCSTGKTFQTLQIVSFPIAAVAAGVGIFLVATSGKSAPKTTGLKVDPQVGPGVGKLDVSYTW